MMQSAEDRSFGEAIDALAYANPFSEERQSLEKRVLGPHFRDTEDAWALGPGHRNANLLLLKERAREFVDRFGKDIAQATPEERTLYASALRFYSYYEFLGAYDRLNRECQEARFKQRKVPVFEDFKKLIFERLPGDELRQQLLGSLEHLFACQFQVYRAFQCIYGTIIGANRPAQKLREAVWQSVFTCDMRRYERSLYRHMHRFNTLILGPSGTGKELVARAIGMSRYLPFDTSSSTFVEEVTNAFFALNISALPATLVESELFGHKRGSFTGAVQDRIGWLEACPEHGTVFLDEVGELDASVQVKLLRTLQSREFQRVGEVELRSFTGKLVSATNRDLADEMTQGRMREDFYYRLCSDVIETPPLRSQLADSPDDLRLLLSHVAKKHFDEVDAEALSAIVEQWIEAELGIDYPWPGNVRELEQCVLNVAVRGSYRAPGRSALPGTGVTDALGKEFLEAGLDVERLLDIYCTLAYARTGSFSEAGRCLGIDRRTVKARLDEQLLLRLRGDHPRYL